MQETLYTVSQRHAAQVEKKGFRVKCRARIIFLLLHSQDRDTDAKAQERSFKLWRG